MDPKQIPRDWKGIILFDGRPAYIFVPYDGMFPTAFTLHGKNVCPYCANELINGSCKCLAFQRAGEYNRQMKKL